MAIASPKKKAEQAQQFKINPEIDNRLNDFMKANADLVQYVKDLPREQLERKFLLRKMKALQGRPLEQRKSSPLLAEPACMPAGSMNGGKSCLS